MFIPYCSAATTRPHPAENGPQNFKSFPSSAPASHWCKKTYWVPPKNSRTLVIAFGTDIIDLEHTDLTYTTSSGLSGLAGVPKADQVIQFFGVVANDPFTSLTMTGKGSDVVGAGDGLSFDQTSFVVVPEPSTLVLMALGAAIGLVRRRLESAAKLAPSSRTGLPVSTRSSSAMTMAVRTPWSH